MAKGVPGTVITIIVAVIAIGGTYYLMSGKSQGSITLNPFNSQAQGTQAQGPVQPYNTNQYPNSIGGGRRKKSGNKKSPIMSTTGVYLLLGAVLVGYITSKIV